jgi:uncharacterized membrane protein
MALVLFRPAFWLLLILSTLILFWLARRLRLRWLPAWGLRAGLISLLLFNIFSPRGELISHLLPPQQILILDESDSVSPEVRLQNKQQAKAWQNARANRLLIVYGSRPHIVLPNSEDWPIVDRRDSNLKAALDMAADLLDKVPGSVTLATDGLVSYPSEIKNIIKQLSDRGHTVELIPLPVRSDPNDGWIGALCAPEGLWEGTPFDIILPVYPPSYGVEPEFQIKINNQSIFVPTEYIGNNYYKLSIPPQSAGIITLEVTANFSKITPDPDPYPQNNSAYAALQIYKAPMALFVTSSPNSNLVKNFNQFLSLNGIQTNIIQPEELPNNLSKLKNYKVIFLHNFLADRLSQEQMLSIQLFVSKFAGGLIFMGGRNGYSLGGYKNTVLEPLLPVNLEPPPRSKRPPVIFLLVLDHSGSMKSISNAKAQPIDLAREAAMRAIENLKAEDYLGVLTFSDNYNWDVDIRKVGDGLDLRQAMDAISGIQASGGTLMYQAMQTSVKVIEALPEELHKATHMILLSDGQSYDGSPSEFEELAQNAQNQNISITTIALGKDADTKLMKSIAQVGKGRYYEVLQVEDLPRIMISESQAARSENIQLGQTSLILGEPDHPILSGMSTNQLPLLNGYNALTSKTDIGAEDVLVSANFKDPILSVWQYGLGRVAAWTGDIGEEWLSEWPSKNTEGRFWSQVVRYVIPNPALDPVQVNVQVTNSYLIAEAHLEDTLNKPIDMAEVSFLYQDGNQKYHTYLLPQVGPGDYQLKIPRPVEGAYRAIMQYQLGDQKIEVPAPFAVNPPSEWKILNPEDGVSNLSAWIGSEGRQQTSFEALLTLEDSRSQQNITNKARNEWLILMLVLLWPLEIVIRRKWLPWS